MIILRAFRKDKEQMLSHMQLMNLQYPKHLNKNIDYNIFEDDRYAIMLQTPYLDCNGKPIFEGDVIETAESKRQRFCYEVVRDESTGNFMAEPFMKGRASIKLGYSVIQKLQDIIPIIDCNPEVIGNKYETPELYKRF